MPLGWRDALAKVCHASRFHFTLTVSASLRRCVFPHGIYTKIQPFLMLVEIPIGAGQQSERLKIIANNCAFDGAR